VVPPYEEGDELVWLGEQVDPAGVGWTKVRDRVGHEGWLLTAALAEAEGLLFTTELAATVDDKIPPSPPVAPLSRAAADQSASNPGRRS
jgi:hypothetical protein